MTVNENSRIAAKDKTKKKRENEKKSRLTTAPLWKLILLIIGLSILCMVVGAAVGYGVIGNGKIMDIFKPSTWTHIIDLVQKS